MLPTATPRVKQRTTSLNFTSADTLQCKALQIWKSGREEDESYYYYHYHYHYCNNNNSGDAGASPFLGTLSDGEVSQKKWADGAEGDSKTAAAAAAATAATATATATIDMEDIIVSAYKRSLMQQMSLFHCCPLPSAMVSDPSNNNTDSNVSAVAAGGGIGVLNASELTAHHHHYLVFDEHVLGTMARLGWNRSHGVVKLMPLACALFEHWKAYGGSSSSNNNNNNNNHKKKI